MARRIGKCDAQRLWAQHWRYRRPIFVLHRRRTDWYARTGVVRHEQYCVVQTRPD